MRYLDTISPHDLGLSQEELDFLMPEAEARFSAFAKKTNFSRSESSQKKSFSDHVSGLKEPSTTLSQAIEAMTVHYLVRTTTARDGDIDIPTVLDDDGLGLEHSSYGSVSVGKPSGSDDFLVGSSALSQYVKSISFNLAKVDNHYADRPALHAGVGRKLELTLSSEQFIMMVRGDSGFYTPCGVQLNNGHWNDSPPSTNFDNHSSLDFEDKINELTQPLNEALLKLKDMIREGASKKGEYAAMVDQSKLASAEYAKVTDAVLAMGNAKGAEEGNRAHRQFVVEMNERLGQLKIGKTLNELLGLTHD